MSSKIRVVVVDDSALMRQMISEILSSDPALEVVATAGDPVQAWERIKTYRPDVVTLDVEMPRMDGVTFLEKLMTHCPMPVVMVSSLTEAGCETTLRALEAGAVEIVQKPKIDVRKGTLDLKGELVAKVKAAAAARAGLARAGLARAASARAGLARTGSAQAGSAHAGSAQAGSAQAGSAQVMSAHAGTAKVVSTGPGSTGPGSTGLGSTGLGSTGIATSTVATSPVTPAATVSHAASSAAKLAAVPSLSRAAHLPLAQPRVIGALAKTTHKVIAIGASTGGTQALVELLTAIPPDAPGIVIVQHMPEHFTRAFADRLNGLCQIQVAEARDGDRVLPGHALIAPGAFHMALTRSGAEYKVRVYDGEPVNRHKPSVDVLFRSCAEVGASNVVAAILTGMGNDGAQGMLAMKQAGAKTIAQDEATCVVFGMPREAILAGGVDQVLPLDRISGELLRLARD